jgi:demethylmenaquinone methyltransferase/2-methoxy-6-polyprenyl-1,4-benzoquinol methylase
MRNFMGNNIEKMFDKIASHYDLLNRILSFGLDKHWRKIGINSLKQYSPKNIIDLACGTGDLSFIANKILIPETINAVDLSENMLKIARLKAKKLKYSENIVFEKQDCEHLRFNNETFDTAIIAFGLRNFENINAALQEIYRVLRKTGRLMILEMSVPDNFLFKKFYYLYIKIIPFWGKCIAKNKTAYQYLPQSIDNFPRPTELVKILQKNGFANTTFRKCSFEVCIIYCAEKTK